MGTNCILAASKMTVWVESKDGYLVLTTDDGGETSCVYLTPNEARQVAVWLNSHATSVESSK